MAQRRYVLPANAFNGTVAGVSVFYNEETKAAVTFLANPELKKYLEDAAVSAALSRGLSTVVIRSLPHTTTINSRGDRIPAEMHITADFGNSGVTAHILCYGFDPRAENYYTYMTHGNPQWSDRATSSNASSPREIGAGEERDANSALSGPQWVATGSEVEGQRHQWWDGVQYTNNFA